jgi:hypothetical protein
MFVAPFFDGVDSRKDTCVALRLLLKWNLRLEQLGEQLESPDRAVAVARTDLPNLCGFNGLVGGPARIRT